MFNSRKIKELNRRITALEEEIKSLLASFSGAKSKKCSVTYEEVINEWLCGKENS